MIAAAAERPWRPVVYIGHRTGPRSGLFLSGRFWTGEAEKRRSWCDDREAMQ